MKRILCYGDSNTWGQNHLDHSQRYDEKTRWTRLKNDQSKVEYEVIEEGLRARTAGTCDDQNHYRSGLDYFKVCLLSHEPLDIIIISLGTNDLKKRYKQSAEQIFNSLCKYSEISSELIPNCNIWFVNQTKFTSIDTEFVNCNNTGRMLNSLLNKSDLNTIDISNILIDSHDGLHYTPINHSQVVKAVINKLKIL